MGGLLFRSFKFYRLMRRKKLKRRWSKGDGCIVAVSMGKQKEPITSWRKLKQMMLRHFRGRKGSSLIEQWLTIQQETAVENYEKNYI